MSEPAVTELVGCSSSVDAGAPMSSRVATAEVSKPSENEGFGCAPDRLPPWTKVGHASSDVELEPIDLADPRQRRRFLDAGEIVQRHDPNYIAPLRIERMRFLDTAHNLSLHALEIQAFLALRNGKLVGRITAHIDRDYNAYHASRTGWFGFFDSIDDVKVAHRLLEQAVCWVHERGMDSIIGPNNFTTNQQTGMLVENFSRPPAIEMTYNPAYYLGLVQSYGFGKAKDLLAFWVDVSQGDADPKIRRFREVSEKACKRFGLRIRSGDLANFEQEVDCVFRLYNESWQRNWGFVPIDEREFKAFAKDLREVIAPELVLIVEDRNGLPIAFSIALPNINEVMPPNGRLFPFGWYKLLFGRKRIKTARLFTLGVIPGYRKRGVEAMLCFETARAAKSLGHSSGEIGWTLEDNILINRAIESFGGQLDRRYRLFGLELR